MVFRLNRHETRARGVAGLTRLPVTEEIAGSNPVGPANKNTLLKCRVFLLVGSPGLGICKASKANDRFSLVRRQYKGDSI